MTGWWFNTRTLSWLGKMLGRPETHASWWVRHAAELTYDLVISGSALLLACLALVVWLALRRRAGASSHRTPAIWLFLAAIALYGLIFSLNAPPTRAQDSRQLFAALSDPSGRPVYSDPFTLYDLSFLSRYHALGRSYHGVYTFSGGYLRALLRRRQGCIAVNQTQMDKLAGQGFAVSPLAYQLLDYPPSGWKVRLRRASALNPLEEVGVLCAR